MKRKYFLTTMVACMVFFTGCNKTDDGKVVLKPELKNAVQYAQSAKILAMFAVQYAPQEEVLKVAAVVRDIISVVEESEGKIAGLILETAKKSIAIGMLPEKYYVFVQALVVLIDTYVNTVEFKLDDIILILKGTLEGIESIKPASEDFLPFTW